MHWKPLTCWITALHPHVFILFWFASSPRTSVQTHWWFFLKKRKKRSIPGDKAFQATTISAMCVCETPTSLLYQHQGTKATQPLHFDEFLVWCLHFLPQQDYLLSLQNAGRTEEKDGLLWFQKYEKFVRPSFDTMQTHFCFISRFLGAWIPSTVKYTINWDGEPLAFWYVVTYFFMCG